MILLKVSDCRLVSTRCFVFHWVSRLGKTTANDIRIQTDTTYHGNEVNLKMENAKTTIRLRFLSDYPWLQIKHRNVAVYIGDHKKWETGKKKWKEENCCQVHFIRAYYIWSPFDTNGLHFTTILDFYLKPIYQPESNFSPFPAWWRQRHSHFSTHWTNRP